MVMLRKYVRVARRRACALAALAACALACAAAARLLAPPTLASVHEFPRARAAHLAHLLADLSAHTLTVPGSWTLDEEAGNYTSWRYSVSYECGARCRGRAAVEAHEPGRPRHGAARAHRVLVAREHCRRPPLLPWPDFCDTTETEFVITSVGPDAGGAEGARLEQTVRARCGAAAALLLRCAGARDLRAAADALLLRVRDKLHNRNHLLVR